MLDLTRYNYCKLENITSKSQILSNISLYNNYFTLIENNNNQLNIYLPVGNYTSHLYLCSVLASSLNSQSINKNYSVL